MSGFAFRVHEFAVTVFAVVFPGAGVIGAVGVIHRTLAFEFTTFEVAFIAFFRFKVIFPLAVGLIEEPTADVSVAVGVGHRALAVHAVAAELTFVHVVVGKNEFAFAFAIAVDKLAGVHGTVRVAEFTGTVLAVTALALSRKIVGKKRCSEQESRHKQADEKIITLHVLKQDLNCFCNKSAGKRRVQAFLFELIKLGKTGFLNREKFNLNFLQTPSRTTK